VNFCTVICVPVLWVHAISCTVVRSNSTAVNTVYVYTAFWRLVLSELDACLFFVCFLWLFLDKWPWSLCIMNIHVCLYSLTQYDGGVFINLKGVHMSSELSFCLWCSFHCNVSLLLLLYQQLLVEILATNSCGECHYFTMYSLWCPGNTQ